MESPSLSYSPTQLALIETPFWFCLRAQPKREHIAATGLRRQLQIECFSPRLRFRKMTRRGAVWFVEAMFPGYLFAHFVYLQQHRNVTYSPGIQAIVQFGDRVATLGSTVIADLRRHAGDEEVVTIDPQIQVGQSVRVTEGPFQGLEAIVTRVLPAKERVRILLDFLGRQVETEISTPKVLSTASPRIDSN